MLNHTILLGRLTKDIELKETKAGKVTTFSIAVKDIEKDKEGKNTTSFFNVIAWKQNAEYLSKYAKKGQEVIVEGRLKQRTYKNKDNKDVTVIELIASNVHLIFKQDNTSEELEDLPY